MKSTEKNINRSWEDMSRHLSGEKNPVPGSYPDDTDQKIFNYLNEMKNSRGEDKAFIDSAWNRLFDRLKEDDLLSGARRQTGFRISQLLRIAAAVILLMGLTFTGKYLITQKNGAAINVVATSNDEKNIKVDFPDGSFAYLNRDSKLSFPEKFGKESREVVLSGEAFFDISPDPEKPFIIDAGEAKVTVLGTSFNVLTDNGNSEVEVMVQTGRVSLSSMKGDNEITLDPGLVGTVGNNSHSSFTNSDPNYLSWNTEVLIFEGTSLKKVFKDLKRVHNITVVPASDDILSGRLTTKFDNQSAETIISMICKSFNLSYEFSDEGFYISR